MEKDALLHASQMCRQKGQSVKRTCLGEVKGLNRFARVLVFSRLREIKRGSLVIEDADGQHYFGETVSDLAASLVIHEASAYQDLLLRGTIGGGEAFIRGAWTSNNLVDVVRVLVVNRQVMTALDGASFVALPMLLWKAGHALHSNSRGGSRRNISAHYDLSNDFFALFLDETMMYSSAVFEHAQASLKDASIAKNERICKKLALQPGDSVVEIGTGWGGFAVHAAKNYGCKVTTTTISQQQFKFAQARIKAEGLDHLVEVVMCDYRDMAAKFGKASFDKLVSIEMIEAVGHAYMGDYFAACSELLKPTGVMLIQAITIPDQEYDRARRSVDYIQKYIFPGSCIPSFASMIAASSRRTDLYLMHVEDITPHYARTLGEWRVRLKDKHAEAYRLGLSDEFLRMWEFYFAYCEGGFAERAIGDAQLLFIKPMARPASILPPLEGYEPHRPTLLEGHG